MDLSKNNQYDSRSETVEMGLSNESTALMRVLVDKKSKNAKSTGLQNVHNESRFLLVDKKCKVYQYEFVHIKY